MEHYGPTVNNPRHLPANRCHGYLLHHAQSVARRLIGDLVADHLDQPAAVAMVEIMGFFAVVKPGLHHSTINFNTPWRNPTGGKEIYVYLF